MNNAKQSNQPAWVAVLDLARLQKREYDAIVARMGVEQEPAADIYLQVAAPMNDDGIRVIELWNDAEGFQSFIQSRMLPAAEALGIQGETVVTVTPLHNLFAPRLTEIPELARTKEV